VFGGLGLVLGQNFVRLFAHFYFSKQQNILANILFKVTDRKINLVLFCKKKRSELLYNSPRHFNKTKIGFLGK
jgi:hypothetical protein